MLRGQDRRRAIISRALLKGEASRHATVMFVAFCRVQIRIRLAAQEILGYALQILQRPLGAVIHRSRS